MATGFLSCGRCNAQMRPAQKGYGFDCLCTPASCHICDSTGHELDARGFCPFCGSDVDNGLRVLIGGWNIADGMPWTLLALRVEDDTWNAFPVPVFDSMGIWGAMGYLAQFNRDITGWGFDYNGNAFIRRGDETETFVRNSSGEYSFAGHGYAWESFTA